MSASAPPTLRTRRLLGIRALVYFYRRRLRAHGTQELLAGVGIAAAVALVLAAGISQGSIAASTRRALRAVTGPANLQLRARGPDGFPAGLLGRVEAIGGVKQAAAILERSIRITGPDGRSASVYVAGSETSLGVLDGLGRTLPLAAYEPHTLALTRASASAIGVGAAGEKVALSVGGQRHLVRVSALLGGETVGVLSGTRFAVMPLASMQALVEEPARVSRILVQTRRGAEPAVRTGLRAIAGDRLEVSGTEQDIDQLEQALRPSGQASTLFAVIGALLGLLLAFNAILLTVPERRQAVADLRMSGTRRSAIAQLVLFQALCLALLATAAGLALGYVLSRWVFAQSTGYLAQAFALSGGTVVPAGTVALAAAGGVLVTCAASSLPLLDLRRSRASDAIYAQEGVPGNALGASVRRATGLAAPRTDRGRERAVRGGAVAGAARNSRARAGDGAGGAERVRGDAGRRAPPQRAGAEPLDAGGRARRRTRDERASGGARRDRGRGVVRQRRARRRPLRPAGRDPRLRPRLRGRCARMGLRTGRQPGHGTASGRRPRPPARGAARGGPSAGVPGQLPQRRRAPRVGDRAAARRREPRAGGAGDRRGRGWGEGAAAPHRRRLGGRLGADRRRASHGGRPRDHAAYADGGEDLPHRRAYEQPRVEPGGALHGCRRLHTGLGQLRAQRDRRPPRPRGQQHGLGAPRWRGPWGRTAAWKS